MPDSTEKRPARFSEVDRFDPHPLGTPKELEPGRVIVVGDALGSTSGAGTGRVHQGVRLILAPVIVDGGAHDRVAFAYLFLAHMTSLTAYGMSLKPILAYALLMSQSSPQVTPSTTPSEAETPAEDRVHHHARVGSDHDPIDGGTIVTLCGLHLPGPRPGAAKLPCCPMCALTMGKACS